MPSNVIQNQYDGPRAPTKRRPESQISLDYIDSNSAAEIDAGIRESIKGVRMSIVAMGLGLAKLKAKGLYTDLNYHSMNDYLEALCDDMQIDRSTAHNWLHIGEAWVKYQKELEKIEFTEEDGPTKLPYVDKALEIHEKKDVFRKVKDLSLRAFKEYARADEPDVTPSKIRVMGNQIFVGKTPVVTFAEELDPKTRGYFEKVNVQAGEALEAGEVLYTTRLYDMSELRGFAAAAERLKKTLRVNRDKRKKKKK